MQRNILEYLEASAAALPESTALADGKTSVTFSQLREQARRLGSAIARVVGQTNRPIAVMTERKVEPFVGFMGALYSGNFYVPVDRKMPPERMRALFGQLKPAAMLLTGRDGATAEQFAELCPRIFLEEGCREEADDELLAHRRSRVLDVDPAYILFTSGSTGAPKGIVVSHRSVIDFTDWFCGTFGFSSRDVLANQAPFYFDLSMRDLYTMLKCGASVHIIPQKCFAFPSLLMDFLDERGVTALNLAASAFHMTANSGILQKRAPATVRKVIVGGEALQAKQLNVWRRALPQAQYVNVYGPTEATVDCCYYFIDREFADTETIPIGKACENMEVFLLDGEGKPVPRGEPGELCVRGSGLALGYFGDGEKTDGAFTQDPRNPWYHDRIYHTGDMAVEDEEGNFVFLARKDNQIKHGGYRIELGEIETALNSLDGVQAAVCFFDHVRDRIHCVYQGTLEPEEIVGGVRELLPRYMLPGAYHRAERMPYNANGKIDRVALKKEYMDEED